MNTASAHHRALPRVRLFPRRRLRAAWLALVPAVTAAGIAAGLLTAPGAMTAAPPAPAALTAAVRAGLIQRIGTYVIRPGDTLGQIAARFCGTAAAYPALAAANGILNANFIVAGRALRITCHGGHAVRASSARARFASHYSFTGLERLWTGAGGPSRAAPRAARIALCESGGYIYARNRFSGAAGLWQILGLPFPGNPYNPFTNARMAVVKFRAAGDSFSPWVCR
jgi:hypothetical protein